MAKSDKKEKKASVKVKEGKKAGPPPKVVSSKEILEKAAKKSKKAPAKPVKKEESESSDSDSEDEKPAPKIVAPKDVSSDESSESSSEDEKPKAAQLKATVPSSAKKIPAKKASSSSEESSDEEPAAKPVKPTPTKAAAPKPASSDSDSDDDTPPTKSVKPTPTKAAAPKPASSDSSDSDSDDDTPPAKVSKTTPAKGAPAKKPASSSSSSSDDEEDGSSESSDDDSDEDGDVKMADAPVNGSSKRKATDDAQPQPKKVKLANGDAASAGDAAQVSLAVFVGQLSWAVDNDRLAQEFADCGEIESATVQMDRNTGKSRGFGYVHFTTPEAVEKALQMNGQEIDGRAIKVDRSLPRDKTQVREKRAQAFGDEVSSPSSTLFVGNLSFGVTEDTVWSFFNDYGVKSVRLPTDRETGRPKGFGYVEFEDIDGAKKAFEAANGSEIEGRSIRLDYSQPRDSSGGGFGGGRGGGGRGGGRGFGDRGRGGRGGGRGGSRGGFGGGDRGYGGGDRGFGGRGGGRGRGAPRGGSKHGIAAFEGKKTTF